MELSAKIIEAVLGLYHRNESFQVLLCDKNINKHRTSANFDDEEISNRCKTNNLEFAKNQHFGQKNSFIIFPLSRLCYIDKFANILKSVLGNI